MFEFAQYREDNRAEIYGYERQINGETVSFCSNAPLAHPAKKIGNISQIRNGKIHRYTKNTTLELSLIANSASFNFGAKFQLILLCPMT